MKKLNLKQPKYIFPLVVFLPLTFLAYEVSGIFDGNRTSSAKVATDSLNMELPDAENEGLKNKMAGMEDRNMGDDGYSAVDGLGDEEGKTDSLGNGYSESEMDQIDKDNAERKAQQKAQEEMERYFFCAFIGVPISTANRVITMYFIVFYYLFVF